MVGDRAHAASEDFKRQSLGVFVDPDQLVERVRQ